MHVSALDFRVVLVYNSIYAHVHKGYPISLVCVCVCVFHFGSNLSRQLLWNASFVHLINSLKTVMTTDIMMDILGSIISKQ